MDHPPYPSTTASTNPSMKRHFGEPAGPGGDAAAAPTRLEKKKSLTTKGSIGEGGGMRSVAALQDTVNDLRAELDRLRKNCTCVICQELLFEPYFLQCGHTYCYHCIVQWVKQASNRKSRCCPECRTPLTIQPAPAYPIRNMVDLFVHHAEIHSVPGSGPDLRKQQLEMAEVVKKHLQGPGLFEGMFLKKPTPVGVRDRDDGVLRCPSCAWEVHDGR
ncbi:hypothetical protein EX30DRAFT_112247 [Ascodesmis nigricans]|uniref:RING-type E3 ubiquitin transferase n=1 Tax=Ascodesmis nigricans TaxID=341454 RepID=A0A4S2MQ73_9PEZI|nr:hypothetical protein EX30DRAFT_112247 [Ascodesmis nigricans]